MSHAVQNFVCKLKPGDVIVAGTDGLFDNVFSHRTTKLVWDAKKHGALPGVAAQQLATFASARSMDPVYLSPFAKAAAQAGFFYRGGKVDDITVVVSYVTAARSSGADAAGGDAQGSTPLEVKSESDSSSSGASSLATPGTPSANPEQASEAPKATPPQQVGDQSASPAEAPAEMATGAVAATHPGHSGAAEEPTTDEGRDNRPSGDASRGRDVPGAARESASTGYVASAADMPPGAQLRSPHVGQQSKL